MIEQLHYIDLFSGCGGISLGLVNAGLNGIFAIEKNQDAFHTLSHNLIINKSLFNWPNWLPVENWDITELLREKSKELSLLRGKIDLVVGGPPCQGFSTAGRRLASDKRNSLIFSYLNIVEIIQPRVIMFENVRGFTLKFSNSKKKDDFSPSEIVIRKLIELGYSDAHGEMINFMNYGVPQRRQRYVVIATRENLSRKIFSSLERDIQSFLTKKGIDPNNSSQTAISDLECKHGTLTCPDSPHFLSGVVSSPKTKFQEYFQLSGKVDYIPDSHRYVNHTPEMTKVFDLLLEKAPRNITIKKEKGLYGFRKRSLTVLDPNQQAPTVTTIPDDILHYSEPRVMTVRECARLQTFPDWYEFKGPYTTGNKERVKQVPRYTQVGNAVPPLFAEQLGNAIKLVLESE